MGELVAIKPPLSADDKRRLIQSAHDDLVGPHLIDERETLADADALAWYDAVLPQATDIKLIAGALEIELSIRRGKLVEQEGELRGGDAGNQYEQKSKSDPVSHFSSAERARRKKDRLLASQETVVRTYTANAIKQGKTPTKRGALCTAYMTRGRGSRVRAVKPGHRQQKSSALNEGRLYQALDKLAAQDRSLSESEIHALTGMSADHLYHVTAHIPWVRRTKSADGLQYTIDTDLREICEGKRPRPQLNGASLSQQLRSLQSEITRRRKERDIYVRRNNWDHLTSHAKFIIELMNWIESELERVATLL